jgi:hypothetical protein
MPKLTRTPRGLRRVRTGYAYQPPALGTYRRRRAASPQGPTYCTYWLRVPASGVPCVPRAVVTWLSPQVAATVPEKPALKYGNIGFDMAGQMHDLAELRERRNAAVTKGMIFMHKVSQPEA